MTERMISCSRAVAEALAEEMQRDETVFIMRSFELGDEVVTRNQCCRDTLLDGIVTKSRSDMGLSDTGRTD